MAAETRGAVEWNSQRRCASRMLFYFSRSVSGNFLKKFTKSTVLHDAILGETCIALHQFHEKKFHSVTV